MSDEFDARLDPDGRYSACGLRRMDKVAQYVLQVVPDAQVERTRDVYQFTVEESGGLVVLVTPDYIEVRLPTVEWTSGYAGPVECSRFLKRRKHTRITEKVFRKLIQEGLATRRQEIQPCAFCERPTPPEHAHTIDNKWVCHGCSERELGLVH